MMSDTKQQSDARHSGGETWMVAIDFSDCSLAAARHAAELARGRGAKLVLINALPLLPAQQKFTSDAASEADRKRIQARLDQLMTSLQSDDEELKMESIIVGSAPVEAILAEAESRGADYLVVGTHGRTGLAHLVLGSVAEQIARRASCPVLIVKAKQ